MQRQQVCRLYPHNPTEQHNVIVIAMLFCCLESAARRVCKTSDKMLTLSCYTSRWEVLCPCCFVQCTKTKPIQGRVFVAAVLHNLFKKGWQYWLAFCSFFLLFCYIFYACVKFLASCFRQNFKKSSRVESHHECKQFLYNSCNNHLLIHQDHAI